MDVGYWQRLKAAFGQLSDIDPEGRSAFWERLKRDDPKLAIDLQELVAAGDEAQRIDWWPVGRELGRAEDFRGNARFAIADRLGVGGFGVVYRAHDTVEGRVVALKVLRVHEPRGLQSFKREFRTVADLRHPNVVAVRDLFVERAHAYFTMEFVDGSSITQSLLAGRDPAQPTAYAEQVREAFHQLCRGLIALHDAGIVHRDLKPSNVLRAASGRVVILDFGQVEVGQRYGSRTGGTPAYAAPESRLGGEVGAPSDWYAVGLMLFECLVGRMPAEHEIRDAPLAIYGGLRGDANLPLDGTCESLATLCEELLREEPSSRAVATRTVGLLTNSVGYLERLPSSIRLTCLDEFSQRVVLFGRERELDALFRYYERAANGEFALCRVLGPSGMGKTALVLEFLHRLRTMRPDAIIVQGGCHERESIGFRVFDGIVDELAERLGTETAAFLGEIIPKHVAELVMLFPALRETFPMAAPLGSKSLDVTRATELRKLAFTGLAEMLSNLARRRLLVVFADDLQWADEDSHHLLRHLLQGSSSLPLLLILAHRNDDAYTGMSPSMATVYGALLPPTAVSVESLRPEDSRALIVNALGSKHPLADFELATRDGVPFLLNLLVDEARSRRIDWTTQGNIQDVDALVFQSIERLSSDARRFIALLTIAGQPLPRDLIYMVLGVSRAAALDLEDSLRVRRLLRTVRTDCLDLFHDRLRSAFRPHIDDTETQELHREIVDALDEDGDPELLAHHCAGARCNELAIRYSWLAARKCVAALAYDRAAKYYRQLVVLGEDGHGLVFSELGDALVNAGKGREAAASYLRAAELQIDRSLELRMRAGQQLLQSGQLAPGRQLLTDVLTEAHVKISRNRVVQGVSLLVRRWRDHRHVSPVLARTRHTSRHDEIVLEALWTISSSYALVDPIGAAYYEARFWSYAVACGDKRSLVRTLILEAFFASIEGSAGQSRMHNLFVEAEQVCLECGEPHVRAILDMARGIVSWAVGDFLKCLEWSNSAEEQMVRSGRVHAFELGTIRAFAMASQIWLGHFREHAARFSVLLADAQQCGDSQTETSLVLLAHAHVHWLVRDCPEAAEQAVQRAIESWPVPDRLALQNVWALFSLAEIHLYRGDIRAAQGLFESRWSAIKRSGHMRIPPIRIWFFYLRARIWMATVRKASTAREIRRALRIVELQTNSLSREELPLGHALATLCSGMLEVASSRPYFARAAFEDAASRFEALGMQLFALASRWAIVSSSEAESNQLAEIESSVAALGVTAPQKILKLLVTVQP